MLRKITFALVAVASLAAASSASALTIKGPIGGGGGFHPGHHFGGYWGGGFGLGLVGADSECYRYVDTRRGVRLVNLCGY